GAAAAAVDAARYSAGTSGRGGSCDGRSSRRWDDACGAAALCPRAKRSRPRRRRETTQEPTDSRHAPRHAPPRHAQIVAQERRSSHEQQSILMAVSRHHVLKSCAEDGISVGDAATAAGWVVAAAAAAAYGHTTYGCSATEPRAFACPEINATLRCVCQGSRATCNGLGASSLGFVASSARAIRSLLASHNDLRELPADFLPNATNLQELTLSYNKIASIDAHFFESLPSLAILDLSHNYLVEFYLPRYGLPNLEILNLTNNLLSQLRFDAQRPVKKARADINRNNMCGVTINDALSGEGLEQLYLSHNKIGNNLSFLRNFTKLTILTLGFNNISKIDLSRFPCDEKLSRRRQYFEIYVTKKV
ncbi:Chaoptin, partial [Gryllus bimaculatus]